MGGWLLAGGQVDGSGRAAAGADGERTDGLIEERADGDDGRRSGVGVGGGGVGRLVRPPEPGGAVPQAENLYPINKAVKSR